MTDTPCPDTPARIHLPSLLTALAIMFGGTLYPPLMADAEGKADHAMALALLLAMSAGLIRGVGFVPRDPLWRKLFSGWTCALALALGVFLKTRH